eukprot:8223133-Alexandrium_andersonii.AAC.1
MKWLEANFSREVSAVCTVVRVQLAVIQGATRSRADPIHRAKAKQAKKVVAGGAPPVGEEPVDLIR